MKMNIGSIHWNCGRRKRFFLAIMTIFAFALTGLPGRAQPNAPTGLLVLHDNEGQFGWLGDIYSLHLQNLLSHFNMPVTRKPFSSYTAGEQCGEL